MTSCAYINIYCREGTGYRLCYTYLYIQVLYRHKFNDYFTYLFANAWILEQEMDWKRPCKLLCHPFYGHLCTFFGLSVATKSTLSHLSVEL